MCSLGALSDSKNRSQDANESLLELRDKKGRKEGKYRSALFGEGKISVADVCSHCHCVTTTTSDSGNEVTKNR